MPRVTVLAGGVGGARFTRGLLACLPAAEVTIVGNIGDDLEHWGLSISPDLDTLLYTLTGRIHPEQGWGVAGDTREAMAVVAELGGVDWFILGDRDIGLHLVRSERLRAGEALSSVTADFARRYGLEAQLLPASDDRLRTRIVTPGGELAFQEWLVGRRAADPVSAVRFEGAPGARPAPGVLEAIESAERIVLAPSNPFVSLDPILAVDGVRAAVETRRDDVVAITPMIGAHAVKGPLAGMLETLGHEVSAVGVAGVVAPLASRFVLDSTDESRAADVRALGLRVTCVPTLMHDPAGAAALARAALEL
jgi:LPPG:FO 2-phospho-L-lactate transferase